MNEEMGDPSERPIYGAHQPHLEKFRLEWDLLEESATRPPSGRVLVTDKIGPACDLPLREVGAHAEPHCFERGTCDVSAIAEKLERGGDEIWSDEFARQHNVPLERPSHDAWGIRKLAFVFCDDFLHRVYRLPLWEDPEWVALLQPVLDCCGVSRSRVVRCLFASMPPLTVIPPHHDTGWWVPKTHRLHCAIKTDLNKVVFRVGRTLGALRRFAFAEGSVVELNNLAKHHVVNLGSEYRTHLIFDYVDDSFLELLPPLMPEIALRIGDTLLQTRRSIDLASEVGTGTFAPHVLILGAQKAGTTSMFEYLAQHPLVLKGVRRETHFLDWRWRADLMEDGGSLACAAAWHSDYFDVDLHARHPSLIACDSTPSYLLCSHLCVPRLLAMHEARGGKVTPMVVMLRDPVDRCASHFAMVTDPGGNAAQRRSRGGSSEGGASWTAQQGGTARDVVRAELEQLVEFGVLRRRFALDGSPHKKPSLKEPYDLDQTAFETKLLPTLPNDHGAHSLLARGLYALQLKPWLRAFDRSNFLFVKCEDMATPQGACEQTHRVLAHVGLRAHPLLNAHPRNTRERDDFDVQLQMDLRAFFRPFNHDLYNLLGWGPDKHWAD